ncbi:MAG: helix-turn-helix domain-containing protein [Oscillospiraceae bacterium]|nr:helix-turn-helix domain-containing protein [Oscillospiraceae bacterium]
MEKIKSMPRQAFVFYESFLEAIALAPDEEQGDLLWYLIECGLNRRKVESLPYPACSIIRQMITNIEYADIRYYAAHGNGEKGGRPRSKVDLELAQELYVQEQSWDKVAEKMGISRATLYRAKRAAGLT